jgi:hypothetical protein
VTTIHPGGGVISGREQVGRAGRRASPGGAPLRRPPGPLGRPLRPAPRPHSEACRPRPPPPPRSGPPRAWPRAPARQVMDSWRAILKGVRPRAFRIEVVDVRVFASDGHGWVTCTEVVDADESQGRRVALGGVRVVFRGFWCVFRGLGRAYTVAQAAAYAIRTSAAGAPQPGGAREGRGPATGTTATTVAPSPLPPPPARPRPQDDRDQRV